MQTGSRLMIGVVATGRFVPFDSPVGKPLQLSRQPPQASGFEGGRIDLTGCDDRALVIFGNPGPVEGWVASTHVYDAPTVTAALTLWLQAKQQPGLKEDVVARLVDPEPSKMCAK